MRRVSLMVTGISGAIAVVTTLMAWIAEESGDPLHPGSNAGWFAFPAGFIALGGLTALLGDVIYSSTAGPVGRDAMSPHPVSTRRRRGAVWLALLSYAIVLVLGALGAPLRTRSTTGTGLGSVIRSSCSCALQPSSGECCVCRGVAPPRGRQHVLMKSRPRALWEAQSAW